MPVNKMVVFSPGQTLKPVIVYIIDDNYIEESKNFTILCTLYNVQIQTTIYIQDDDGE